MLYFELNKEVLQGKSYFFIIEEVNKGTIV